MLKKQRIFKQKRSEKTHRAILKAASKVFPKKGFEGAQVSDIARAAGVSVGIVYRYFEDKRAIFLEMLEAHLSAARAQVAARLAPDQFVGTAPADAVARVLDVIFEEAARDTALARVYLAASLTDKDVAKMRTDAEVYDRSVLASVLEAATSRDRIPDPSATALIIERAVQGTAIDCILGSKTVSADAAKAALRSMIGSWLF